MVAIAVLPRVEAIIEVHGIKRIIIFYEGDKRYPLRFMRVV